MIGHEGPKNLWLLCGNVPVLVASQNVSIVHRKLLHKLFSRVIPSYLQTFVNDGGQQSFFDARRVAAGQDDDIVLFWRMLCLFEIKIYRQFRKRTMKS